jgi:hypothetical protein
MQLCKIVETSIHFESVLFVFTEKWIDYSWNSRAGDHITAMSFGNVAGKKPTRYLPSGE